ncbi:hypothetical protein BH11PSE11_BH11PSE11_04740 [soil metagenome]
MQINRDDKGATDELRQAQRLQLRRPAQIKDKDITLMYAITTDISNGGLGLMAPNPMREGQTLAIAFDVRDDGKMKTVSIGGTVTHCAKDPRGYKAGVRMVEIHPGSLDVIKNLTQ